MSEPFDLSGKTILVTGASSGLGRQICITASRMGANIIATGRNKDKLAETAGMSIKEKVEMIICDLNDSENMLDMVKKLPGLNGVVYSAGIVKFMPLKFANKKIINDVFQINCIAPIILISELLKKRLIFNNSSIVFINSIMSKIAVLGNGIYSASKSALSGFAKVLALELSSQKIRVNSISPGMVRTPMADQTAKILSEDAIKEDEKKYPLGYGEPEDISNTVIFLLSDASKWMTGSDVIIDGGYLIQ
jgi:NAD(P)-dependent dehydrogenase (short-subunit alcohol dehydrogenase family)